MKIERIAIENLASLRGRQPDISLTGGELEDVGLIAITGATGAGKTTVLDAVCLALFDRTPRLRGRGQDPRELLSRGASQARAVVDLTLDDGTTWTCEWSVHRARSQADGALQASRQRITDRTTGEILADGKRSVQDLVERHLGLSFEQFTGVILLAQGAFANFLESTDTERSALLERLTGTEIYSRLGKAAFERHKALRQEVETEESRWRDVEPLEAAKRTAIEQEIDELEPSLIRLEAHLDSLAERLLWLDRRKGLEEKATAAASALAAALEASRAAAEPRRRANEAEQAMALVAPLELADGALRRAKESAALLEKAEAEEERSSLDLRRAQAQLAEDFRVLDFSIEHARREVERLAGLEAASPAALGELRDRRRDAEAQEEGRERAVAELRIRREDSRRAEKMAEKSASQAELAGNRVRATRDLVEDLATRRRLAVGSSSREALAARDIRLEQAKKVREELERLNPEHLAEEVAGTRHEQQKARTEHDAVASLSAGARRELEHEEKVLRLAEKGAELAVHRHDLEPGQPCPLCGSRDHPRIGAEALDEDRETLRASEEKIAGLRAELKRISSDLIDAEKALRQADNDLERALQRQEEGRQEEIDLTAAWVSLRLQLLDLPADPFAIETEALGERQAEARQKLETISLFDDESEALQEELETRRAAAADAERNSAVAEARRGEAARRLAEGEQRRDGADEDVKLAWAAWREIAERLATACDFEAPAETQLAMSFEENLGQAHRDYVAAHGEEADLLDLAERLASRTKILNDLGLADEVATGGSAQAPSAGQAESAELLAGRFATRLPVAEEAGQRQRLAADRRVQAREAHQQAVEESRSASKHLEQALAASPFTELGPLRSAIVDPKELEALRQHLLELKLDIERRRTDHRRVNEELEEHLGAEERDSEGDRPQLLATQSEMRGRHSQAKDRKFSLRLELKQDDERREKRQTLEEQLGVLRDSLARAARLAELIGQSDGGKFRRFAQQLNLDQLLGLANLRLERLAPRYALARIAGGLELEVIDRDMADERRPTSTLSGGESFLVSLALALGLADLRRGQLRLGTLFLDEGFGSLDEETLDTALSTLEQLQAEQETQILIISHVGALQERIAHRVAVEKKGGGRSRLRLIVDEAGSGDGADWVPF